MPLLAGANDLIAADSVYPLGPRPPPPPLPLLSLSSLPSTLNISDRLQPNNDRLFLALDPGHVAHLGKETRGEEGKGEEKWMREGEGGHDAGESPLLVFALSSQVPLLHNILRRAVHGPAPANQDWSQHSLPVEAQPLPCAGSTIMDVGVRGV